MHVNQTEACIPGHRWLDSAALLICASLAKLLPAAACFHAWPLLQIGLGFSVFLVLLLIETFGSPFIRNTMVIWALLGGFLAAAVST